MSDADGHVNFFTEDPRDYIGKARYSHDGGAIAAEPYSPSEAFVPVTSVMVASAKAKSNEASSES